MDARDDAPTTVEGALTLARDIHEAKVIGFDAEVRDQDERIAALAAEITMLKARCREERTRRRAAEAAVVEVRAALAEYRRLGFLGDACDTVDEINTIVKAP